METKPVVSSKRALRVGTQPYLSAKPLVWALKKIAPQVEITEHNPRALSSLLVSGKLDVALVPLVTVLRHPDLAIVPGISVSTIGKARNAMIFSKVASADIKNILVDRSSVNSVALIRALFRIRWSMQPLEVLSSNPLTPDYPFMERDYDAYMMIGDNAMNVKTEFEKTIDLGEQWEQWTHVPLVHAVWAIREDIQGPPIDKFLLEAKKHGIYDLGEIIQHATAHLGMEKEQCRQLLKNTSYDLKKHHVKGIERFHYYMEAVKICKPQLTLKFYHGDHVKVHNLIKEEN